MEAASKIAIRHGERKSGEYLRLEICIVMISGELGRILIPDLRLEIRMLPVGKALERGPRGPRVTQPFAMLPILLISKNSPTDVNRIEGVFLSVLIRLSTGSRPEIS